MTVEEKSSLKDLRSLVIGKTVVRRREIVEYQGQEFEIREPSVEELEEIRGRVFDPTKKNYKMAEYRVVGLIETLYVPGTDVKVFSDGDYDALMASPAGGPIELLSDKMFKLFSADVDDAKKN